MAGTAAPSGVPGLEDTFQKAGVEGYVEAASVWCDKMGARFLEELGDEETFPELAEALQLKPLEKRRLKKALDAVCGLRSPNALSPANTGGYAPATLSPAASATLQPATSTGLQPARSQHTVFVKNTFLDIDDSLRPKEFSRARSVPVYGVSQVEDDTGDLDDEEEDVDDAPGDHTDSLANGDLASTPSVATPQMLYKTVTLDGYETASDWDWARMTPQQEWSPTAAEQTVASAVAAEQAQPDYNCTDMSGAYVGQQQFASYMMVPTTAHEVMHMGHCMMVPVPDRFMRWPEEYEEPEVVEKDHTRKNVLEKAFSVHNTEIYRVRWTVDARKLKSKDTEAVSPPFALGEASIEFKMFIRARVVAETKGGASFKKARGRGVVELRCLAPPESASLPVNFRIAIGSPADPTKQQQPRGPVVHDFAREKPICGLPKPHDEWNFSQVVDKATQTFVVVLEVINGPPRSTSSPQSS